MSLHGEDSSTVASPDDQAILYDLSQLVEWPEEKEIVGSSTHEEIQAGAITGSVKRWCSSISRWTWSTVRAVGIPVRTGTPCLLPPDLIKLIGSQQSWLFAQSDDGKFIAVLQDTCLEIRSSKEDFNTLVGRCTFCRDQYPQWRKVAWSLYATAIAFSDSDGTVHVCDLKGILMFSYQEERLQNEQLFDYSTAICGLVFIGDEVSKHKETSLHLLIVTYSGAVTCIEINNMYEIGYKVAFKFDFAACYPNGVSSVVYHKEHGLIIVGGCAGYRDTAEGVPKATKCGLTVWRLLSDEPFLKLLRVYTEASNEKARPSLLRRLSVVPSDLGQKLRGKSLDGIYTIALSPCGNFLAAIHLMGSLSLWDIPSMRHKRSWKQEEHPHSDEVDPEASNSISYSKRLKEYPLLHNVIDCNWWSESAVILARCTGSLAVVGVSGNHLENLFGEQCEWLEPAPRVSSCRDEGFLALECETRMKTLKRQRNDTNEEPPNEEENEPDPFLDDSDTEEKPGATGRLMEYAKSTVYDFTELEYFRPPRKRAKLITKMYRLISLTKTTPEKLFERKIEAEEYGEALVLAQTYGLDCDRVFQRQWRKSPVSLATIQDYLSKVSKRSWVLHECCERVPEELEATRELLKFALRVTDLDEIAGGNRNASYRSDISDASDSDSYYEEYEGFDVEEQRRQEIQQRQKYVKKWSRKIDFQNLTLEQKEMIRARRKVFKYLDRLATYEYLMGGYDAARERYDPTRFETFRQQDMLTSAIEYARTCEWTSVETLLTFHGYELKEHRLTILSNFPKTLSPSEYKSLLPELTENNEAIPSPEESHRDPVDWCEEEEYKHAFTPLTDSFDPAAEFYDENPDLKQFRTASPSVEVLRTWYKQQAIQMDLDARDIEGALDILKFGTERGVDGLDSLLRDFRTLEILVYECDYDPGLTLVQLQQTSNVKRLEMLMKKSSTEMYIKNFHRWAIPFLKSCNEEQSGLASGVFKTFVSDMAENNLSLPSLLFCTFITDRNMPGSIVDLKSLIQLALNSVYINCNPDQLDFVKQIHLCLSKVERSTLRNVSLECQDKIERLGKHVHACKMLATYKVKVTPSFIADVEGDRQKVHKLFVRLSRTAGGREPPLSKNEWTTLLNDMLQLREQIFAKTSSIESAVCLEVYVESLLTSGSVANLQIAGERMMRTAEEEHDASQRRLYTSPQKLSYESSVALVVKSSQEYFDASTPISNDNMLSIARECLLLITDRPPLIREKLDLIEGVVLLHHFGIDKLPLQVRLSEDRMKLVQMAIDVDDNAYRKTEPLLRLGMLLRVCGSEKDERKGKILIMIINKALNISDYQSAYCLCQELISMSFKPAWEVCLKLALCENFTDSEGKRDILAYAACYCDGDRLKEVMDQMCVINSLLLQQALNEHEKLEEDASADTMQNSESNDTDHVEMSQDSEVDNRSNPLNKLMMTTSTFLSPSKMLQNTAKGTKAMLSVTGTVLSATTNTTKAVLSNVGNTGWWRSTISQTLSALPGTEVQAHEENDDVAVLSNDDFECQGCPEFYSSIIENSISTHGLDLAAGSYSVPTEISLNQAKLRIARLQLQSQNNMMELSKESESSILKDLVSHVMPYDFALGISYLLAMAESEDAFACLRDFPMSALSIQIPLHYFSLCFMSSFSQDLSQATRASMYELAPIKLIEKAVTLASGNFENERKLKSVASYLVMLKEQMFDFSQGEKLQKLGRGIDLGRFTKDPEYKEETILGLAMTSDEDQYKFAVTLAHRSGTDLWLVLATHLEFLFTECQEELDCMKLHTHVKKLNMVPELITRPGEFFERMDKFVYPFISGQDHDRLHLYFSLLNECRGSTTSFVSVHDMCNIVFSEHIKMLKKVKSMTPSLDYKSLVTDDLDTDTIEEATKRILTVLRPVLDNSNIQMFAKMMPKIPYSRHTTTSSSLYLQVAQSLIWKDVTEDASANDWIPRYESCNSCLRMLNPSDLLKFYKEFIFLSKNSSLLNQKDRQDVMKRGVKLCKIQGTKERKNQLNEDILSSSESFQTVLPTFILMSKHLDSYSTSFMSDMVKNSATDPKMENYQRTYDKAFLEPGGILGLSSLMLCEGQSPYFVQNFLAVVPNNKISPFYVLQNTVQSITEKFLGDEMDKSEASNEMRSLVSNISNHEKQKGKVMTSKQVIELLRSFCGDSTVDVQLRVDILQLLENQFELYESEAKLLLFHRTHAVVKDGWGDKIFEEIIDGELDAETVTEAVSNERNRIKIFENLLSLNSPDLNKLKHLINLLNMWPKFSDARTRNKCWKNVLTGLVGVGAAGGKEIVEVVREQNGEIATENLKDIFDQLVESDLTFFAIKIALLAKLTNMDEKLVDTLKSVKCMGPSQCDEELLKLLLENGVAADTLTTIYYPRITEYLLSGDCPDAEVHIRNLARQLQDRGHMPEAGALLMNFRGTHPAFRTFSNALSSLSRWLHS